jgi:hypothetical protein
VSHWLLVCLAKEEPLACDTLVVDAATAAPDADFSSATEREHERLEPRIVDVLNLDRTVRSLAGSCFD